MLHVAKLPAGPHGWGRGKMEDRAMNSSIRDHRPAGGDPYGVRFEPLENRLLLSGDVTAVVADDGSLTLTGDSQDNAILIDMVGTGSGEIRVSSGDGSTTINGQTGPVILSGLTGVVDAKMGKGADSVTVNSAVLPGSLLIDGGDGDTTVTLSKSQVAGDLFVSGRNGNGTVGLALSGVTGQVAVQHGNGNLSVAAAMSSIGGSLQVLGRKGYDQVFLTGYVTIGGDVDLDLRDGGSRLTLFQAFMGGQLNIRATKGADEILLNTATVAGDIRIDTGDDADGIDIMDLTASAGVSIDTGKGDDTVDVETGGMPYGLRTTIAGLLDIDTSDGNDTITIGVAGVDAWSANLNGGATIDGGRGNDTLDWNDNGNTVTGPTLVVDVESIL